MCEIVWTASFILNHHFCSMTVVGPVRPAAIHHVSLASGTCHIQVSINRCHHAQGTRHDFNFCKPPRRRTGTCARAEQRGGVEQSHRLCWQRAVWQIHAAPRSSACKDVTAVLQGGALYFRLAQNDLRFILFHLSRFHTPFSRWLPDDVISRTNQGMLCLASTICAYLLPPGIAPQPVYRIRDE